MAILNSPERIEQQVLAKAIGKERNWLTDVKAGRRPPGEAMKKAVQILGCTARGANFWGGFRFGEIVLGVVIGLFFWGDGKDCGRGASEVLGNHSPGGYMKIILAVLGLVLLVGCQDLGDYPDYKATTSPPANGTGGGTGGNSEKRPHDVIPLGGPTMIGERDLYCENATQPFFMIEVSSDTTRAWALYFVPESLYIMNEIRVVGGKKYVFVNGTAASIGNFIVPIGITNSYVSSTVYVTMHITAKRQSVSQ